MGDGGFRTTPASDPRLAPYATSAQPVWLWSTDGSRILWCNAAAAAVLGIDDLRELEKPLSPTDPHRRQVAQLARRLGSQASPRLERLSGFGARLGQLATCSCSPLTAESGEAAILLVRLAPAAPAAAARPPQPAPPPPETEAPAFEHLPAESEAAPAPIEAAAGCRDADAQSPAPPVPEQIAEDRHENPVSAAPLADEAEAADAATADAAPPIAAGNPLRFVWQIDGAGRFALASDAFLALAGEPTAALQERPWHEVAQALDLDPRGRIARAIGAHETFSGLAAAWPLDGQEHGRVELSGMPVFDAAHGFAGYRGFGIYRGQAAASDAEPPDALPPDEHTSDAEPDVQDAPDPPVQSTSAEAEPAAPDNPSLAETEIVEPPQNVVPFPLANEPRIPSLSAVENHAFDEIARRLTQKFDELNAQRLANAAEASEAAERQAAQQQQEPTQEASPAQPAWLAPVAAPAHGDSSRERMLLDLMPSGILIYRLDRLLYANRAFLGRIGYESLHVLQEAGGLDALYVEPGPGHASSASDDGMPLTIAHSADDRAPADARLFSIVWDGETAHALILQEARIAAEPPAAAPPIAAPAPAPPPPLPAPLPAPAAAPYEAILETATDGIVLFDRSGAIISSNRSAQMMFDMSAKELCARNFADLFAAESQRVVLDYFETVDGPLETGPRDHGREVTGRTRTGGGVPLSMTMGRSDGDGFFAVFRDLSQSKKSETELSHARRNAERATSARADALARIGREVREPLDTIVGLANAAIEGRSGAPGSERLADCLKDIRAAGERAIAVLDDLINVSNVESGQVPLKLVSQNLNEIVEQCVGMLQPQANRERVIIRTSLARALPLVLADTQSLRQIMMNIVTSSIRCSKAGGQVIVSTAPSDSGGAVLRVRDTGRALSDAELASAAGGLDRGAAERGAIDLSLARALAEANRAQFQVRSSDNTGTLIEVAFANTRALAG